MGQKCCLSSSALIMLVLMAISVTGTAAAALTPLVHMTNHCYKNVYVNDSLILDLTENLQADRVMVGHLSCAVTLHAPKGARLYLHVLQLAISDHAQMPDRLHIYDVSSTGKITKRLTPSTGLYGVLERPFLIYNTAGMIVPDFRSAGPRMRLDYQGKPTIIYRGFRVLVTVFYSPEVKGGCRSGTLHCPYAGTCLPLSVRCDGFPNCGLDDNNDEKSCRREYVVSNVLDEYSTRTAVIAAVTGILVFLGVAALVFVIVLKYTRKKYGRGTDQSVRYTSRGGGACQYKNEEDLTRLYAPPSYEDVMTPQGQTLSSPHRYSGHRHCGPPPAYSAVAAALIHQEEGAASSEDEVSLKRPSTLWSDPPPSHQPPASQRHHLRGACPDDLEEEEEEDVRMHGTWPSDTDEEEEVRARRRKKGGKSKGKPKHSSRVENGTSSSKGGGRREGDRAPSRSVRFHGDDKPQSAPACEPDLGDRAGGAPPSPFSSPECTSDCSPAHQVCLSAGSSDVPSDVPSGSGSGGEVVSETESQLASSKRNSRTESNSPDTSSTSSQPDSPAKQALPAREGRSPKETSADDLNELHHDSPSSINPLSPSVLPLTKLSPKTSSEDSLLQTKMGPDLDDTSEDFVDLNPSKSSNKQDCSLHSS